MADAISGDLTLTTHADELANGERFAFGENWSKFLADLDENRVGIAEDSIASMLGVRDLSGKRFLDIGCGSGLFSLAARRLGATVHSFDYDPASVACAQTLRQRYLPNCQGWTIDRGSVLDVNYMRSLGEFDVVYSWGVLHHTGSMWTGLENLVERVAPGGQAFIAIYNDQGTASRRWRKVKRLYCASPRWFRGVILALCLGRIWGRSFLLDLLRGRPGYSWRAYATGTTGTARGMSAWRDLVDWVGGYPFEVAKPEEIFEFFRSRGFRLERLVTCGGGYGCNEFVFVRDAASAPNRLVG